MINNHYSDYLTIILFSVESEGSICLILNHSELELVKLVALQLRPDTRFVEKVQFIVVKHLWLKNYSLARLLPMSDKQNYFYQ